MTVMVLMRSAIDFDCGLKILRLMLLSGNPAAATGNPTPAIPLNAPGRGGGANPSLSTPGPGRDRVCLNHCAAVFPFWRLTEARWRTLRFRAGGGAAGVV